MGIITHPLWSHARVVALLQHPRLINTAWSTQIRYRSSTFVHNLFVIYPGPFKGVICNLAAEFIRTRINDDTYLLIVRVMVVPNRHERKPNGRMGIFIRLACLFHCPS